MEEPKEKEIKKGEEKDVMKRRESRELETDRGEREENMQRNETKEKEKMFEDNKIKIGEIGCNEKGEVCLEELQSEKREMEEGEVLDEKEDDENKEVCNNCRKETTSMIECDGCGNWMCRSCSNIATNKKMNEVALITRTKGVNWFCRGCEIERKERKNGKGKGENNKYCEKMKELEERIEKLEDEKKEEKEKRKKNGRRNKKENM